MSLKQSYKDCFNKLRRHLYGWTTSVQMSWHFIDPNEGLAKENVSAVDPFWLCVFHVVYTAQGTSNKYEHFTVQHARFLPVGSPGGSPAFFRKLGSVLAG